MNVYSVVCLETGDYNNLYSNASKVVRAFLNLYAEEVDMRGMNEKEIITELKKKGYITFYRTYDGESVELSKVGVY